MKENDFMADICSELVRAMGPVAPIVLAEKMKSLGISGDILQMDKIGQLVETLSYEIQDEMSRVEFQKGALLHLKRHMALAGV